MNSKLSQIPFFRLLIPLIVGITLAFYFPIHTFLAIAFFAFSFCLLLGWFWYNNKKQDFANRWIFGVLLGLFLIATGYSLTILKNPYQSNSYYGKYLSGASDSLIVTILSPPQEKEKTIKAIAEISEIMVNGKSIATQGKALLYFEKDSMASNIKYGDILYVHVFLQNIKRSSNPYEFDYRNYLAMHGIYHEGYIKSGKYYFTGRNNAWWLTGFTYKCREKLISLLNYRIKGSEAAIASAILLGYRDDLSQTIIQQFADSGTIHVICVAGLHVGILFWLLGLMLLPLKKLQYGKLLRTILLVLLLWLYAIFTGLATPVLRATVMFSFLFIGRHFGKYTHSINTLAASAFILLLLNPFAIADTGFQLSYLSVLGIIVIYPMLKNIFVIHNTILEKIWELACLSISAQLSIAPLSILYFHQFPNYFAFTNLLIVPLLSVVLYVGLLFFVTSYIPFISNLATWPLKKSLLLMNYFVTKTAHLPYFVSRGLSISIPEALLLYLVLLAIFIFTMNKKSNYLFIGLSCFALFLGIRIWKQYIHSRQELFVIYDIPRQTAVAFISGNESVTTQTIDSLNFCYHVQYHWWALGITDSSSIRNNNAILLSKHLYMQNNLAEFNNMKVAFVGNTVDTVPINNKIKIKYLVLSGHYKKNIAALQNAFIFDKLIFDSSVSPYKLKKWEDECEHIQVPYYDVNKQGAFVESELE